MDLDSNTVIEAVASLRNGECIAACAAGANVMLGPENFIAEASLHMLSPTGKSRMWDIDADGYARGEGIAVVMLKTLSQALAHGDKIQGIIRETGVNSDGRTQGITMPSPAAQKELIMETYRKSGLDSKDPQDRCQYFEAHGKLKSLLHLAQSINLSQVLVLRLEIVAKPRRLARHSSLHQIWMLIRMQSSS